MKKYFKRLRFHPGIRMATGLTVLGFFGGALNGSCVHWYSGGAFGAAVMGIIVWSMVLISNL